MTELERARAHLRECQGYLSRCRRYGYEIGNIKFHENTVLAALSWVWEEQMKLEIPLQYALVWSRS